MRNNKVNSYNKHFSPIFALISSGGGYKSLLATRRLPSSLFFSALALLSSGLILSLVLSSISTSQSSSAATNPTTVSADIIRVAFGLSIETDPSVTLNVKPTPAGAMTIASSIVTTGTSSPSGYTLYLQMTGENSTTNSLINSVDATATLTSSGSFVSPTVLANGTWGYAIPSGSTSLLSTNGFDDSYTEAESVAQTGSKFAAIPTTNSPAEKIAETHGPSVVELPVYYAAMASYDTISGTYSNKVLYTALADDTPIHAASVSPTSIFDEGAETLNVFTPLHTTNPDVLAEAYLLTPEQYTAVTRAENPVPISTYSANKMTCTRTEADSVTLSCTTIPTTAGNAYVYVDIPGYNDHYDAFITIKPKNLTIAVQNTNTTSGAPSVKVPYGSSATVTVTPNAGYYLGGVTCPTGFTCTGYTTGTSATTQQTVTITHDDALTGGTIGFTGTTRSFTVDITNSNTTSGSSSITVPYGGSATVTVTPASGYYLSGVSCPSGYTCTGYSTDSTQTGTQTVTVTNNNTAAGGTLKFTGALILTQMCSNASVGSTFTYSGVDYIKLKTNSDGTTSACYTKTSRGTATWNNAASLCPANTGVPTQAEFQSLIDAYGDDGTIHNTIGWYGAYWSSTQNPDDTSHAYRLLVSFNHAYISHYPKTTSYDVVCIVR